MQRVMKTRFNFNTIGLFTTDNESMVAFYRDIMGDSALVISLTRKETSSKFILLP